MDKKDAFNVYAAHALGLLYEARPYPLTLVPSKIVRGLGHEENKQNISVCQHTLSWLCDEGFFRSPATCWSGNPSVAESAFVDARLTIAGLTALNEKIDFRGSSQRIGDVLSDQARNVGTTTRDAVVAELVGKLIGAATRALVGS